ncbi:MAG TPA: hypothetical protein VGG90_05600 [Candidatus Dormibacteraeota bacterium]
MSLPVKLWRAAKSFLARVAAMFNAWPADDFGRFANASVGTGMPGATAAMEPAPPRPPATVPPAAFEVRFMRLHSEGRFDEMWDMLAEDAQRAWGGRETFMRDMPRLDGDTELLEVRTVSVAVLDDWTDQTHRRSYNNVARLVMRYRVKQQWKEWTFDRQVHLVPAAGGWRTLCYPTRGGVAAGR